MPGKTIVSWKNLDETERSIYDETYKKEKAAYDRAMKAYKKTDAYMQFQEALVKLKEDGCKGKKKKTRKNVSAYNVFFKDCHAEMLKKGKDLPMAERASCIAKMRREVDPAAREKYQFLAEERNKYLKLEENK